MTLAQYTSIPIEENDDKLVDLSKFDFILELHYFKEGLSDTDKMYVREQVAKKLEKIQSKLGGFKFKIWDAYRPRKVQKNIYQSFWNKLKEKNSNWDENRLREEVGKFVSPTNVGGRIPPHATGGAIDLTLVDSTGMELNMGTCFDYFGPEASPDYKDLTTEILNNRKLLHDSMLVEDFTPDIDEWWHFDFGNQLWALRSGKEQAIYGEV